MEENVEFDVSTTREDPAVEEEASLVQKDSTNTSTINGGKEKRHAVLQGVKSAFAFILYFSGMVLFGWLLFYLSKGLL